MTLSENWKSGDSTIMKCVWTKALIPLSVNMHVYSFFARHRAIQKKHKAMNSYAWQTNFKHFVPGSRGQRKLDIVI